MPGFKLGLFAMQYFFTKKKIKGKQPIRLSKIYTVLWPDNNKFDSILLKIQRKLTLIFKNSSLRRIMHLRLSLVQKLNDIKVS